MSSKNRQDGFKGFGKPYHNYSTKNPRGVITEGFRKCGIDISSPVSRKIIELYTKNGGILTDEILDQMEAVAMGGGSL
jgi:hypothetical protein